MSDGIIPVERLLATAAKVLCSAVFVSGRDPEEAFGNSAATALHAAQLPDAMAPLMRWRVERDTRRVEISARIDAAAARRLVEVCRATWPDYDADWRAETGRLAQLGEVRRIARFTGDQGAIIVPRDGNADLGFTPVRVKRGPVPSAGWLPESMRDGEALPRARRDAARRRVGRVIEAAFEDRDGHHAAILVTQHGHLVGERYAEEFHADMPLESWSMGKSVLGALVGQLVGLGALGLDSPTPVASWQTPDDLRGGITPRHLLNMSSGLACSGMDEPRHAWNGPLPDHFMPYAGAVDVARYAVDRPLEHSPGTVGRYRNCDPLVLATVLNDIVRDALGEEPLSWPQKALFDRIGMHGFVHETDRRGRFIITGFNYGCARDWARLGHLYLDDGVWNGERILPAGWVEFSRTPAPAWPEADYGAQLWINSNRSFPLPPETFYLYGGGGQYVFVLPRERVVIVRQGHTKGWAGAKAKVEGLLSDIVAALDRG